MMNFSLVDVTRVALEISSPQFSFFVHLVATLCFPFFFFFFFDFCFPTKHCLGQPMAHTLRYILVYILLNSFV